MASHSFRAIIWSNAGKLFIGSWWTNSNEILIEIHAFQFKKMYLECCLQDDDHFVGLNVVKRSTFKATATSQISKIHSFNGWIPFLNNKDIFLFAFVATKRSYRFIYLFFFFFFFFGGGGVFILCSSLLHVLCIVTQVQHVKSSNLVHARYLVLKRAYKTYMANKCIKVLLYALCLSNQDQGHYITVMTLNERLL